jgi:aminoglycoside phosphotransferase (APT) family kinase protein
MQAMLIAAGSRIGWADLAPEVRGAVEELLGSAVVEARSQAGGFSPGTADRVVLADGRRAFVKAVSRDQNDRSVELARREAAVTAAFPASLPAPRLLGSYDDGHWVAMIFEDVEGRHPRTPWVAAELAAAVTALRELARAATPPPVAAIPTAADSLRPNFAGWHRIAADRPADLDPWAARRLGELRAAADRGLVALGEGRTLVHGDIRADNLLVRGDGSIVIVDWPWACAGPEWLDRVLLGINVIFGGGDPGLAFAEVEPAVCADVLAGFAGYLLDISRLPDPPSMPTVRAFQRAQAIALLPWLRANLT